MRLRLPLVGLFMASLLSACAMAAQTSALTAASPTHHPSPTPTPTPTPTATPSPTPTPIDATYIANELADVEQAIRVSDTPESLYQTLGVREQKALHLLEAHPDWIPVVLNAVPVSVRQSIQNDLTAAQQIGTLNGVSSTLPHWKIIAPPPPDTLLGYYNEAQQAYGVAWQYLAAINLIETNMGRIQGLSSAGAQGPMQFMPATWASYGHGDVNNPRDAILAAGRYLQVHGAPQNMTRAIYAYNPSMLYVRAVQLYAQEMFANARTFYAYYNWQVYVPTNNGDVYLPEGFSN